MAKYLIITKIPKRQGLLGPISEKTILDEAEGESVEAIKEGLRIPIDGECLIVPQKHVITVKPRIVNDIV